MSAWAGNIFPSGLPLSLSFLLWPLPTHLSHCLCNTICLSFSFLLLFFFFLLRWGSNILSCPLLPSLPPVSVSGWNCGGGQLCLCRWRTSLPWWCSMMTPCPPATVAIGDRQVHRVLSQAHFQHQGRLITLSLQRCKTSSPSHLLLTEPSWGGGGLQNDICNLEETLFGVWMQTCPCFSDRAAHTDTIGT